MRVFRTGMPAFNQARAELGLAPLRDLADALDAVDRVLVCTSPSYDFAADDVPGNARVLDEPGYQTAARRMAATLAAERDEGLVVDELERAAMSHPARRDPSWR
jgi:hypothetical protein